MQPNRPRYGPARVGRPRSQPELLQCSRLVTSSRQRETDPSRREEDSVWSVPSGHRQGRCHCPRWNCLSFDGRRSDRRFRGLCNKSSHRIDRRVVEHERLRQFRVEALGERVRELRRRDRIQSDGHERRVCGDSRPEDIRERARDGLDDSRRALRLSALRSLRQIQFGLRLCLCHLKLRLQYFRRVFINRQSLCDGPLRGVVEEEGRGQLRV